MDNRSLPFAMPGIGSEEEEAIALLSYVADDLLGEHHREVDRARKRAERYSTYAFGLALFSLALFLIQDFEFAPILTLLIPAVIAVLFLTAGIFLRTRVVAPDRFSLPQILHAQKLSWQWLAVPVDEERVLIWDTLCDETLALDLPPTPPARPDWLLRELASQRSIDEEKALIGRLGDILKIWKSPSETVRLPHLRENDEPLLDLLMSLPRGRRWLPAPLLPPARALEDGQEEMERLMRLHREHRIFLRQLDAWEEAVPRFRASLERALRAALPTMDPPPSPPTSHPSGDVEAVLGTLDLVRSTAVETLRVPLKEELVRLNDALEGRIASLTKEWEMERNAIHYSSEAVIGSLKRQLEDMEQRIIPEAQQSLSQAQMKLREATDRVAKTEAELADRRKQLLLAGSVSDNSPRASDDRKRELSAAIDRLGSAIPEMKRGVSTWEEVVAAHRTALERSQRQLERLQREYDDHAGQRERQLEKIDTSFETRQGVVRDSTAPARQAIEADLQFFDILMERFSTALSPYRVDLMMEDTTIRPYNEVLQQASQVLENKLAAVGNWADEVLRLIRERRQAVLKIVKEMEQAAKPNFGLTEPRILLLPVWYVESRRGVVSLWPWNRGEQGHRLHVVAPFVEAKEGRRLALPGGHPMMLVPLPALQARLDTLRDGARWKELQLAARQLGRTISFNPKVLNAIAHSTQMPRAMIQLLLAQHRGLLPDQPAPALPPGSALVAAPTQAGSGSPAALSDEFVPDAPASPDADAWQEREAPVVNEADDDRWQDEPVSESQGEGIEKPGG